MGFFDYAQAYEAYRGDERMTAVIGRLEELDAYHLLRGGSALWEKLPVKNGAYKKWVSVCDGGMLFSSTLFSISAHDKTLDLNFSTLKQANGGEAKAQWGVPAGYSVIGQWNTGDPICLPDGDDRVCQWDREQGRFDTVWDSFADFLADECNTALHMLQDGVLMPIPLKTEEGPADE